MFNLYLFGAPRLENQNQPVALDTRKAIALLAYLAVTRATHRRDMLAALLYPEYDQPHARGALRRTLATLHAALGDDVLAIDRESLSLSAHAPLIVDVTEFQNILNECKHQHSADELCAECVQPFTRAAELYRGEFMAGFTLRDSASFDDWQIATAENLRRDFANVLEKLVAFHTQQASFAPAIAYARRWLALDPLHEPAHRQLMQLYAWNHQRAAALRQYDECVRVLNQELGVAPLAETTRLYLDLKAQRQPPQPPSSPLPPSTSAPAHYPLVGRADELAALQRAYAALQTNGHWLALEGEAGIGKTRLVEEFLERIPKPAAVILTGRAYEGDTNLAYGVFVEALRAAKEHPDLRAKIPAAWRGEVARLVPEIGEGQTMPPLDSAIARGRFFEGISQSLFALMRGAAPGILFLDDLQWADSASLDLLTYVVQRLRGHPAYIIATWRSENAAAIERLRQLNAQASRAHLATLIALARLPASAVTQLVASTIGNAATITQKISERLNRETEGLPFFIVEYLQALDHAAPANFDWALPNGVRDLMHARLTRISETGKQVLSTAAVIGRSFDFETLGDASGRTEEEVIQALEELTAQGIVKEIAGENLRYDFGHEKLRELAYAETSTARRRLLHRRVAEALVNRGRARHDTDALANQIARHYELADEKTRAAEYYRAAGDYARGLFANAQALAYYRAALNLPTANVLVEQLHEASGDLQTLLGDYAGALASYAAAANMSTPNALARIEHKRGMVHQRQGEYRIAEQHFQIALEALAQDAAGERSRLLVDWSLAAHGRGENARAQEMASRALALAEAANDKPALAQARNVLGILARHRGDARQARYQLEQSCAIAEAWHKPGVQIAALNNLALVCRDSGDYERAIQLTESALALCTAMGDRHREAALHNNLADLYHAQKRGDEAMRHLKQAVALFAEIGGDEHATQPEVWKLVEW